MLRASHMATERHAATATGSPEDIPMASPALRILLPMSALALASAAIAPDASAQALEPGMRIRVTGTDGSKRVGTVGAVQHDTVRFTAPSGATFVVATADVARLELSMGKQRNFVGNFVTTTVGFMALGGAIGAATWSDCDSAGWGCMFTPGSRTDALLAGALVGGLVGVPAGIVVGAASRPERWERIKQQRDTTRQVSIRPILGNRIGASATLQF